MGFQKVFLKGIQDKVDVIVHLSNYQLSKKKIKIKKIKIQLNLNSL